MPLEPEELKAALAVMDGAEPEAEQAPAQPEATEAEAAPKEPAPKSKELSPKKDDAEALKKPGEEEPKRERFSRQWALAQKTAKEAEALKRQIDEERSHLAKEREEIEKVRRLINDSPEEFVEKNGGADFIKKLTRVYGGKPNDPAEEVVNLRKELESIRSEVKSTFEKERQAEQEKQAQSIIEDYRRGISGAVTSKDDLDLVRAMGQEEEAMELAGIYASQYKQVLTPEEAAFKIQEELRSEYLPKIAKTRSLQEHFRENPDDLRAIAEALGYSLGNGKRRGASSESKPPQTTLSNSLRGDSPAGDGDDEILSRKGEVQRALANLTV